MSIEAKTEAELYLDTIPAMPAIAAKIMHLLGDVNVSVQEIATTISADQAVAAKVLQVANSPFYGLARKVQNIKQAIVIMGLTGIKSIVITVSTRNVYKQPGLLQKMLWEHSVGTAMASFTIAKNTRAILPDDAFIGGLLHDVGKTIMYGAQTEKYQKLVETGYNNQFTVQQFVEAEQETFSCTHMDVGALAIEKWQLSADCAKIAATHHDVRGSETPTDTNQMFWACVALGNLFCHHIGIGLREKDTSMILEESLPAKLLSLPQDEIQNLLETTDQYFQDEMEKFRF